MDIILFLLLIFLPGYFLFNLLHEDLEVFLLPPLAFVYGLLLLTLSAIPSYLLRLDFSSSLMITTTYTILLFILAVKKKRLIPKLELNFDFISLSLTVLVIGSILMMFWIPPNLDGDALYHLGQIRRLAENSPVNPYEAFFPIDKVSPAYGYSVWYFTVGLIAYLSKIDTVQVWSHLIFVLLPISILALFAFALGVFKDRFLALVSSLVYLFLFGYLGSAWELRLAPYPDQIARHIVLFISLYFFLMFINGRRYKYLILSVVTASLLSTIHLYSWVHFLIAIASFGAFSLLLKNFNHFKSSIAVAFLTVLISAPYLYLKLQNAATIVGKFAIKKDALVLFDKIFIIDPLSRGPIFLLSVFALVYLVFQFRKGLKKHIWLIFLLSNALGASFIIFNPILAPLTARLISYTYMHRLGYLFYLELILAAFLVFSVFRINKTRQLDKLVKSLTIAAILSVLIIIPIKFNSTYAEGNKEKDFRKLAEFIKTELPEKQIYAADMWTSYRIPAYTNNYIVATFKSHMTFTANAKDRLNDLQLIISSRGTPGETKELIDKYNVSFVVVSSQRNNRYDYFVDSNKFEKDDDFKEVFSENSYKIYSYQERKVLDD